MNKEQQLEYLKRELRRVLEKAHHIQADIDQLKRELIDNEQIKRESE